jgi:hypothetical protein
MNTSTVFQKLVRLLQKFPESRSTHHDTQVQLAKSFRHNTCIIVMPSWISHLRSLLERRG